MNFQKSCCKIAGTLGIIIGTITFAPNIALANNVAPQLNLSNREASESYRRGDYHRAIAILERLVSKSEPGIEKAILFSNLAAAYCQIGDLKKAFLNWEESISLAEKINNNQAQVVWLKSVLSSSPSYIDIGFNSRVIPRLEKAIELSKKSEKWLDFEARALGILGDAYLSLREYERAIDSYQKGLQIKKDALLSVNLSQAFWRQASQLEFLAITASEAKDFDSANELQSSAISALTQAKTIALTALKQSQQQGIREALAARLNLLKLDRDRASKYKSEVLNLIDQIPNSSYKALKLVEAAQLLDPEKALPVLDQAATIAEKLGEGRVLSFAYGEIGKIYKAQKQYERAIRFTSSGLLAAESALASDQLFRLYWQIAQIQTAQRKTEDAIKSYDSALWNLRSNRSLYVNSNNGLLFALRNEVEPFFKEYIELLLTSSSDKDSFQKAIEILNIFKLSELQNYFNDPCFEVIASTTSTPSTVNPHTATIYSFVLSEKTYLLLKLPDNSYKLITLDLTSEKLKEKIVNFRSYIGRQSFQYVQYSQEIYSTLIVPIELSLKDYQIDTLVFIQDGILRNIPMEALLTADNQFLIEKYNILYLTGLQTEKTQSSDEGDNIFFGLSVSRLGLPELPFVSEEASFVSLYLGAEIILDSQFTEKNFFDYLAERQYSTIHLATHGNFQGTAKNSWLLSFDKKMTLEDLKNALLSTSRPPMLLIFSACETASGNEEATLGFAGVGLRARVNKVVGSLWAIPDRSTALFMEEFYAQLSQGKALIEAKRIAQLKLLNENKKPSIWAGLILIDNSP
ncbi:MAG: CHAT domain-containing protein [Prochloraceae cyanobacterium]|nr:CHAT domain-containing protein [Prochloraceae cyanobacterium]